VNSLLPRFFLQVAVDVPLPGLFDYAVAPHSDLALSAQDWLGRLVVVPWGSGRRLGIVFATTLEPSTSPEKIKCVAELVDQAPVMSAAWRKLLEFASSYYCCGPGELAVPIVPKVLRQAPSKTRVSINKRRARSQVATITQTAKLAAANEPVKKELLPQQQATLARLNAQPGYICHLIYGITGSGKTEVYLQWFAHILRQDAQAQVLLLVPEIGLTPQLVKQVQERFAHETIAVLHSGLTEAKRAENWLLASDGLARIVVGTRLAVMTPLPNLRAVVVDEEHDASYRQMEGVHYSARDLAIARCSQENLPIVLGSATPSAESWVAAQRKRYELHVLSERATGAALPSIAVLDIKRAKLVHGLLASTIQAIASTIESGRQVLVFINRRGYAPVLQCNACGWVSQCDACSAFRVMHRQRNGYKLLCHHCTAQSAVPTRCPDCGAVDLTGVGKGTQRVEDQLNEVFVTARIARLDRDVSSKVGAAAAVLNAIHAGETDLIVGTQILAKGHDFQRLGLVVVLDADQGLFSSDFRAPERLFANLIQVAGRAGRAAEVEGAPGAKVIVQTRHPEHMLFEHLKRHDYASFMAVTLQERQDNGLPPFMFQVLLKAQARQVDPLMAFLKEAQQCANDLQQSKFEAMQIYSPVPMPIARIANLDRAQLLLECASRKTLHAFLSTWISQLRGIKFLGRWQIEVDPQEI
jgi:primosomal protein N' (replication factor Y) (superfamily II helicase)